MSQVSLPKSIADNIQEAYEILLNEHKALEEEHAAACAFVEYKYGTAKKLSQPDSIHKMYRQTFEAAERRDHIAEAVATVERNLRSLETLIGIK